MKSLIIHLVAFWNVAVVNCVQPPNWEYCYRVDQWLVPEMIEGYKPVSYTHLTLPTILRV